MLRISAQHAQDQCTAAAAAVAAAMALSGGSSSRGGGDGAQRGQPCLEAHWHAARDGGGGWGRRAGCAVPTSTLFEC